MILLHLLVRDCSIGLSYGIVSCMSNVNLAGWLRLVSMGIKVSNDEIVDFK